MLRFATIGMIFLTLASAVGLYVVNYRARATELSILKAEAKLEELDREIATLRAERAFLSRPDRIEPLARQLGMRPARGSQFAPLPETGTTADGMTATTKPSRNP